MTDSVERLRETLVADDAWYQGRLKTSDTLLERFSRERHEAADEIDHLRKENEKLRAAFRVNMLRAFPNMSHEEIDAEISAAIRESGDE